MDLGTGGGAAQARPEPGARSVGHAVLPAWLRLRRGHPVSLDTEAQKREGQVSSARPPEHSRRIADRPRSATATVPRPSSGGSKPVGIYHASEARFPIGVHWSVFIAMNDESNIADIVVDSADFHSSGWKTILSNESQAGYWAMSSAFSVGDRQAIEKNEPTHSKVLLLLSDACSLVLSPQSRNEPFKPFSVMNGRRSAIPDDFSASEIDLFAQVVDAVDDPRLKARLADLVWLSKTPRDHQFALSAVDAYRLVPIDKDTWGLDGQECWERAIGLARMLGKGAGDRIAAIESAILAAFKLATAQDGFLCLRLADMLETNTLERTHGAMIAQKLERIAGEYDTAGYSDRSCEYFSTASKWFKIAGDEKKAISMTVAKAEG